LFYFIDHGFQDFETSILANMYGIKQINTLQHLLNSTFDRFTNIKHSIQNRLFYTKSYSFFNNKEQNDLKLFKKLRLGNTVLNTLSKTESDLILPEHFICFSEYNFQFYHQLYPNHELSEKTVSYIGVPEFDDYFPIKSSTPKRKYVLFIDQPYTYANFYGWNINNKTKFISELKTAIENQGRELIIKKHLVEEKFWKGLKLELKFIDNEQFKSRIADFDVILGYNSTLLLLFAGIKNVQIYCLRNHPIPNNITPPLIETGIAQWMNDNYILEFNDSIIDEVNAEKFIYKSDGKSRDRLFKILLDEPV